MDSILHQSVVTSFDIIYIIRFHYIGNIKYNSEICTTELSDTFWPERLKQNISTNDIITTNQQKREIEIIIIPSEFCGEWKLTS